MAEALHTIIISGSDQNRNARKLRGVLETSEALDGAVTAAGLKAVMKKGGSTIDEKLSLYLEDRKTIGVSILTSPDLKSFIDAKSETSKAGIQIGSENVQLRGSRLHKLLEDQKGKIILISFENTANIPECLEDINTEEIIKVEPDAKGLVNAQKLIDERVDVTILSKLKELSKSSKLNAS